MMSDAEAKSEKIRIYIDQGHNPTPYHNKGAEGSGLYEQDLTYRIGCLLAELLTNDGRFEVCLSRPNEDTVLGTDSSTSLQARVEGAKAFRADYFISLHINAYTQDSASGIEVFASDAYQESHSFGSFLLRGMVESTKLKDRGMRPSSELYVLENAEMPAVLLEMGFISNANDAALLAESPELFAQGIYNGILNYFAVAYVQDLHILLWTIGAAAVCGVAFATAMEFLKKRKDLERQHDKSDQA